MKYYFAIKMTGMGELMAGYRSKKKDN